MISASLRGLRARKLRTILTAIAVVLGVAMVAGTLVMGDTVRKAFDRYYASYDAGTTAVVKGELAVTDSDQSVPPAIPASLLRQVAAIPGVRLAGGRIEDTAQLFDRQGHVIGGNAPQFGYSTLSSSLTGLRLSGGRWPHGPGQVVIDAYTARHQHYRVGDTIRVATKRPTRAFRVTGFVEYPGLDSGAATFAVFDQATAQTLFQKQGKLDKIRVQAAPGVSTAELLQRLRAAHLEAPVPLAIVSARQDQRDVEGDTALFVDFLTYALLAFGGIALFVGAFIIFNTFSITIAQRTKELSLLRMLGASRRQVLLSVLAETAVVGVAAAIGGTALGIGLGAGLLALFQALGAGLPVVGLVVGPGPLLVAPLVGLLVTLLAGLAPAIRATRVAPIEALAESRGATARRGRVLPSIGGALLAGAVGILSYGLLGDPGSIKARLLLVAVGSLLLFVSTAMLAPLLVPPLVRLMQIPLRVGGVSGVIAGENARRQPGRTAATSAALMIGLALVAFMAIFANGVTKMIDRSYDRSLAADYMISSSSYGATMDAAVAGRVARAPGIAEVTQIRRDVARIQGGSRHQAFGVDPGTIGQLYRFEWDRGSAATLASLGSHGVLVERTIARSEHLRVGSRLTLTTPIGRREAFTVKGIYHDEVLLAGLMLPLSTYRDAFGQRDDSYVLASARSGADVETTRAALRRVLAGYTGLKVDTHASLRQANHADGQNIVTLFDALLALSILISVFGIVNTLALSVLERQRELGLLRAVGASRRQVRRMVRYESILTAWIGATLGLVLGVFLAWMVIKAVGQGLEFSPPLGSLAIHAAFATVVGVLAAVLPARRAARTDVLVALAYE